MDSGIAGALNALTPVFTICIAAIFFRTKTGIEKISGIIIAFGGSLLLSLAQRKTGGSTALKDVALIMTATVCYGINLNLVTQRLKHLDSTELASAALTINAIPAIIVLLISGFHRHNFSNPQLWKAIGYVATLGLLGTALASVLFYRLMKNAGMVFSSMVTYVIPIIALLWGLTIGEKIGRTEIAGMLIILTGVFIANIKMFRRKAV